MIQLSKLVLPSSLDGVAAAAAAAAAVAVANAVVAVMVELAVAVPFMRCQMHLIDCSVCAARVSNGGRGLLTCLAVAAVVVGLCRCDIDMKMMVS